MPHISYSVSRRLASCLDLLTMQILQLLPRPRSSLWLSYRVGYEQIAHRDPLTQSGLLGWRVRYRRPAVALVPSQM